MTTLVIGAAGTIGRACVQVLAEQGGAESVVALDLTPSGVVGVRDHRLDVTDVDAVRSLLNTLEGESSITGLIYAAGLNTTGEVDDIQWDDYERVMEVNLRGAFHVGAVMMGILRRRPRSFGSAFISSTAGLAGEAGGSIYCASKFGLIGFATSFAAEIARFQGRANVVCPGNVDSPMLDRLAGHVGGREGLAGSEILDRWRRSTVFNRLIHPREVAETCTWLVSQSASGVSGQVIVVDGPRA